MPILYDAQNLISNGGTEIMMRGLESRLDPALLDQVYISRSMVEFNKVPNDKPKIFWTHEVPASPQNDIDEYNAMRSRWRTFSHVVCVSNWQMNEYCRAFDITWNDLERFQVLKNAIVPIEKHEKPQGKIRLVYTSSPQRGLVILFEAFKQIADKHPDIELEVFSSFKLYNNPAENDATYQRLFDELMAHPKVIYRGAQPNAEVRESLKQSHIFAYPCIWGETSCISLIEAMSAGCLCIHPNNAALFETGGGITDTYHYQPNPIKHVEVFKDRLEVAINRWRSGDVAILETQKTYADYIYSWDGRVKQWEDYIRGVIK